MHIRMYVCMYVYNIYIYIYIYSALYYIKYELLCLWNPTFKIKAKTSGGLNRVLIEPQRALMEP